jgi:alkanesulfonate monooxygenase SsuD/methylene tetrahydromethanopterin reductase-like flavin-dependent oxidoreductase (luciferase family)
MKVGLGLPLDDHTVLLTWARRADAGPFTTLAMADRILYHNPEPLIALAAVAGATERIRVQTEVLIMPARQTTLVAKQAATLHKISGGRFTLGIGAGIRDDDFAATGTDFKTRGKRLDEQMATVRAGGHEILFGAFRPAALERVARWGDGHLSAAPPKMSDQLFRTVERYWKDHGRDGAPRLVVQVNAALGPESTLEDARANIRSYYRFTGPYADQQAANLVTTESGVRAALQAFEDIGADEVIFYCWATDPDQVDRFADATG